MIFNPITSVAFCDGCLEDYPATLEQSWLKDGLMAEMEDNGWLVGLHWDRTYCPECKEGRQ